MLLIIISATLARAAGECTLGRTRYMFIRPNLRLVGKLIVYINGADNIARFRVWGSAYAAGGGGSVLLIEGPCGGCGCERDFVFCLHYD